MTTLPETRRQQILDAAADYFQKYGFHKASMAEISAAAQMSPGSVYRYFKSKEEIIEALFVRNWDRAVDGIQQFRLVVADCRPYAEQFVRILLTGLTSPLPLDPFFMEMRTEAMHNTRVAEIERKGILDIEYGLAQALSEAQQAGHLPPSVQPEQAAKFMVALLEGLVMTKSLFPETDPMDYAPLFMKILS